MTRKVGVEIEFAGVDFEQASDVIERALGVEPDVVSPHEHSFEVEAGTFRLEVDFALLKRLSREEFESDADDGLRQVAIEALDAVSGLVTPLELVTPPWPERDLERLVELQRALEEAGAVGTGDSIVCAYGVHFNPEGELDPASITAHLRAFLCLYDWLKERDETDLSRQLTSYIDPFPEAYEGEVIDPDFAPSTTELIDHYLAHNPTRNRALDLLPMFAEIDLDRVAAAIDDERIKARPTYHYRLPNSRIGEPGWDLLEPWRGWLEVERLAANRERLAEACRRRADWIEQCRRLVAAR